MWRGRFSNSPIVVLSLYPSFWNKIFQLLSTLIGQTVNPLIDIAILHIGLKNLPNACRILALHIHLAAKLNITRRWHNRTPPSLQSFIADQLLVFYGKGHGTHVQLLACIHQVIETVVKQPYKLCFFRRLFLCTLTHPGVDTHLFSITQRTILLHRTKPLVYVAWIYLPWFLVFLLIWCL